MPAVWMTSNSAVSVVYGCSSNSAIVGLTGPEYPGLGIMATWPSVVIDFSFQGPSTTCHRGLLLYVPTDFDWPSRYLNTLTACFGSRSKSPTVPPSVVLSQTCWGSGLIWLSYVSSKK